MIRGKERSIVFTYANYRIYVLDPLLLVIGLARKFFRFFKLKIAYTIFSSKMNEI